MHTALTLYLFPYIFLCFAALVRTPFPVDLKLKLRLIGDNEKRCHVGAAIELS